MKTLYVSDLDGTLLRSDATLSPDTLRFFKEGKGQALAFSYATARSYHTAARVTEGLEPKAPIICYNGAAILSIGDRRPPVS